MINRIGRNYLNYTEYINNTGINKGIFNKELENKEVDREELEKYDKMYLDNGYYYFPPADAPAEVKRAWFEATKDMSFQDRYLAEGMFTAQVISANSKPGGGSYKPSDPEFIDIFKTKGYARVIQEKRILLHDNPYKNQFREQFEKNLDFLDKLEKMFKDRNIR